MSHPPPRPALRYAKPSDAEALRALQQEIYREGRWFVGDGPPSTAALQRQLRGLDPQQSLVLVATFGGAVCAWLELNRLQAQRLNHVAVLTLAVAQRQRRYGLGRELLGRAIAWARQVGIEKISLNVRSGNEAAIALYRATGFVQEGRERRHIRGDNGFEDNLVMAAFLNGGPSAGG
jgi:ribosomal protein S18 acetylase RimI-like enzyme